MAFVYVIEKILKTERVLMVRYKKILLPLIVLFFVFSVFVRTFAKNNTLNNQFLNMSMNKSLGDDVTYEIKQDGYIYIYWGQKPTGGYVIKIKELKFSEGTLYVYYYTKSPSPNEMVIQVITYPSDRAKIPDGVEVKNVKLIKVDDNYGDVDEYFPLKRGTFWIYNYEIKQKYGERGFIKKQGKIKMEVTNVYTTDDYKLFEVKGDVLNFDPNRRIGFITVSNSVYMIDSKALGFLVSNSSEYKNFNSLSNKFNKNIKLIFNFPLYHGKKYSEWVLRKDNLYLWSVSKEGKFIWKNKTYEKYKLEYRQLTDKMIIYFVPKIGIVSIEFTHNSTFDRSKAQLISFSLR